MVNKKTKKTLKNIGIGVLIFAVLGLIILSSGIFTLYSEQVWIAHYFSADCTLRAENMAQHVVDTHTDEPTWYHCTSAESGTWIPQAPGIQCEYEFSEFSMFEAKICEGYTENKADLKTSKCKDVGPSVVATTKETVVVNAGDTLYVNTGRVFGDTVLKARYPAYGLKAESASNYKFSQTLSCDLNSLNKDVATIGSKGLKIVAPGVPFNAVTDFYPGTSTHVVTLTDVEGGKPIYIFRAGYYQVIQKTDDGRLYVATELGEKYNKNIECIPRTTGCDDNAKIIKLVEQPCDKYGGMLAGYNPVEDDPTQLCKYKCVDGKLARTDDCVSIPTKCPDDKPLWDSTTGECKALEVEKEDCKEGYIFVEEEIEYCPEGFIGMLCKLGITDKEKSTRSFCKKETPMIAYIVLASAIIIAFGLISYGLISKKRRR